MSHAVPAARSPVAGGWEPLAAIGLRPGVSAWPRRRAFPFQRARFGNLLPSVPGGPVTIGMRHRALLQPGPEGVADHPGGLPRCAKSTFWEATGETPFR